MSKAIRFTVLLAAVVLVFSCASSEKKSDFEMDIDDDGIRVALSKEIARSMIEGLIGKDLECDGDFDGEMRTLFEELDRKGPGSRASFHDGETTVNGRRRGGKLDLDIRGAESGRIEATMPWKVAECMLGTRTTIDRTLSSSVKVKVSNPDGKNFSFKLQ